MFESMNGLMGQFQLMQKLMADDNFKAFIAHPKVQEVFRDSEFKEIAKSQDFSKILSNPKFASLMRDPEISTLMTRINPQQFMKG